MPFKDALFLVVLAVIGITIPGAVVYIHFLGADSALRPAHQSSLHFITYLFLLLPAGVCFLNLFTSIFRPWRHSRKFGNMKNYRHVSGIPIFGGFLVFAAALLLPPSQIIGAILLILYLMDTGGIHWFFYSILRHGL